MLCSLLFRNCTTLEDYKHALAIRIRIFTVLDMVGVFAMILNISSESTTLFTFSDFTHGFFQGFGISLILVSTIIICYTRKLLQDENKLLTKFSKLNPTH